MKKISILVAATVALTAGNAFAVAGIPTVPEIDALSGIAALAVVGAAVALIRERSK